MELLGYFDSIIGNRIVGWAKYAESEEEVEVSVRIGDFSTSTIANKYREGLKNKGIHSTGCCAFDFDIGDFLPEGKNSVEIDVSVNGKNLKNSPKIHYYGSENMERKKLALIHIPKTAGTSINGWLESKLNPSLCINHLESKRELQSKNILDNYDFVSGHLNYGNFARLLSDGFKIAVVLREPMQQLISHINWVWYISSDEESSFFLNHPKEIKELSLRIRSLNFEKPADLQVFVSELSDVGISLFDNCQTRYLMEHNKSGKRLKVDDLKNAISNLERVDFVGQTDNLQPFVEQVAKVLKLDERQSLQKLNRRVQESIIPLSDEHIKALHPLVVLDYELWDAVKRK